MSLPEPRKTRWFASTQRRKGNNTSKGKERPSAASSHAPNVEFPTSIPQADLVTVVVHPDEVVATGRVGEIAQPDPVQAIVVQSFEPPPESAAPFEQKKKSKEDGKPSSKRSYRSGSSSLVPLPTGVFDPAFDAASRVDFRPNSSQQAVLESLSEGELLRAAVELMSRGVMLAWNARELGSGREGRDLLRELAQEQDVSPTLCHRVETLTRDHDFCDENQTKLQADLDESRLQLSNATK